MKEFFVSGQHGFTWQPHDVDSACQAMRLAIETGRVVLSANCRVTALQHSWHNAATQIERVYVDLTVRRAATKTTVLSYAKQKLFGLAILAKWVYLMLLVCSFMLPFMKVFKPSKEMVAMKLQQQQNIDETVPSCLAKRANANSNGRKRSYRKKSSKRTRADNTSSTDSSREGSKDRTVSARPRRSNALAAKSGFGLLRYLRRRVDLVRASFVSFSTHVATLVISVASITVMFAICLNINTLFVNSSAVAYE
jgi:hypothetical protein